MMQKYRFYIFLVILGAFLLGACGQKTTVDLALDSKSIAVVQTPDFFLRLISFTYDSSVTDSPVTVAWEGTGEFPEGFLLIWSADDAFAEAGSSGWAKVSDGSAREAMIAVDHSQAHFFRICKVLGDTCIGYSDPVQVVFSDPPEGADQALDEVEKQPTTEATKTNAPTMTAMPEAVIAITDVFGDEKGSVTVSWTVEGDAPQGFKLIWSGSNETPTYPENENQRVNDPTARSATQKGFTPGIQYFYRVCQFMDGACQAYSNVVAYKVPLPKTATIAPKPTETSTGLVITNVSETAKGQVSVSWTAQGNYPNGFKVVFSKDTSTPVYPGNQYVYLTNPAARNAAVTGLTEGKKYYFRVCKFNGSGCDFYSNTFSIVLSGGGSTDEKIVLNSISKVNDTKVKLDWSATGSFPKGFKIVYSSHNTSPVYPGDQYVYLSDPAARSAYVESLKAGETYYFRVCKYNGSGCDFYSNMKEYTVPGTTPTKKPTVMPTPDASSITLQPIVDAGCGSVTITWTADGSFPSGFKVVWSDTNTAPVFPGDSYYYASDPAARQTTIASLTQGSTYYFRVCRYKGSNCDVYSNAAQFTLPSCEPTKEPVP